MGSTGLNRSQQVSTGLNRSQQVSTEAMLTSGYGMPALSI